MTTTKTFSEDNFSKKIISLSKYDSSILTTLYYKNKKIIETSAAKVLVRYFEHIVDAKARSSPQSLQHIYEFNMSGKKESRLFRSKIIPSPVGAVVSFYFIQAKYPNNNGQVFYNKAQIMEDGTTVTVRPKKSKYLIYKLNDGRFIKTEKPSIITNPGGNVKGNFEKEFNDFTYRTADMVLKNYRYFEKINQSIEVKRNMVVPIINNLSISNFSLKGNMDAEMIAKEIERIGN